MTGIECIINLLPIICADSQEFGLIDKLNNFFNFDHNLFLLDSSTDIDRYVKTTGKLEFIPQSLYVFKGENITGLQSLQEVKSKNTFLIVVPESGNFENNSKLLSRIKEIQGSHINLKIGIFFSKPTSSEDLKQLFEWSWQQRMMNIFIATYSSQNVTKESTSEHFLNMFTYNPFGTFHVINLTGSAQFDNLFLKQNCNFQQHPLQLGNSVKQIWRPVVLLMNATWGVNISLYDNNSIQIFDFARNASKRLFMYPLCPMYYYVIIVPEALPYPEFFGYLRTLTDNIIGYIFLTIAGIILVLRIFRYNSHKKNLFFQSVVDVLNLLMNDNAGIQYEQLHRIEVFLIVPLTFCGLIIVNGYLSAMQSYVTRPVIQPEIRTIEDLYNSQYPIETVESAAKFEIDFLENQSPHGDWGDRIRIVKSFEHVLHIFMYNTSITFFWDRASAKMLMENQKRFNIRGYRYLTTPMISFGCYTMPFKDDFPFSERVNDIIQRLATAGLWEKWVQVSNRVTTDNLYKKYKSLQDRPEPGDASLPVPSFIFYGWFASIIVLVIEIIWKYLKLSKIASYLLEKMQACRTIFCEKCLGRKVRIEEHWSK